MIVEASAYVCLIWSTAVAIVAFTGQIQLFRNFWSPPPPKAIEAQDAPYVTVVRPVKGLEPSLYECLASTFRQQYPSNRMQWRFCISNREDSALPVLERLLRDYPDVDASILVENEDQVLRDGGLGPNPKIRNMSRAYREAPLDALIWIVDCNVWVGEHACAAMVSTLRGDDSSIPNKFVHQLPLVVDTIGTTEREETQGLTGGSVNSRDSGIDGTRLSNAQRSWWTVGGGRLEEAFMSSSHAKFYTAINTVLVAPCIVGKSTMFRREHLDSLTANQGIDYFSRNICEDHMIGDLLWKRQVPEEVAGAKFGKHALCWGHLAIQPMSSMSVGEYWNRRVRWLRVRKYTVMVATLVEPGTESFLCSAYLAYAATTIPQLTSLVGETAPYWAKFMCVWLLSICLWHCADFILFRMMHSGSSVQVNEHTPEFARPLKGHLRHPYTQWALAWLGREALALPIWLWAFWGGNTVRWRGKQFRVGLDMKVHDITSVQDEGETSTSSLLANGKARQD